MIKGYRMQGISPSSAPAKTATVNSGTTLLSVPTGKTFIMTDLVVAFVSGLSTGVAPPGVVVYDKTTAANGAALTFGDGQKMVLRKQNPVILETSTGQRANCAEPLVLTNMKNGVEFSSAVVVASVCSYAIPTYGAFVAGIVR